MTFEVSGAGTGKLQGTFTTALNESGSITGWVLGSTGYHGFLRTP